MRKLFTNVIAIRTKYLLVAIALMGSHSHLFAQTYVTEGFAASIPYNIATPNLRVTTTDWLQGKIVGIAGAPNDFQWVNTANYPVAANEARAGFAGAGWVRYINRNIAYTFGTPDVNFSMAGNAAFLATRSLDLSGRAAYNAIADTFSLSVWRDNTAGPTAVADYIEVYINTTPDITGATLLDVTTINDNLTPIAAGTNRIHRSSTLAPLANIVANTWNRYRFLLPNLPAYVGATATSNAYIIIKAVSAAGNNIYMDNFNLPQWQTAMTITGASLVYQESADVGKASTQNLLLGMKITTKGSTAPLKLDGIAYNSNGSTNWLNDVVSSANNTPPYMYSYFTGGTSTFATGSGAVNMPFNLTAFTGDISAPMSFGWFVTACGIPATPATMTLNPGNENNVWFSVDVKAGAGSGNYIGAEFLYAIVRTATPACFAWGVNAAGTSTGSANLTTTQLVSQTSGLKRQVALAYPIPTLTTGTSWSSYNSNDFVSAVSSTGENASIKLDNYIHDVLCIGGYPNRYSCHPPDYTQFPPANLGAYKERTTQYQVGRGIRNGTAAYTMQAMCGTWPSSNGMAVFIDWNKDGDFDDRYAGVGGNIDENYGTKVQTGGAVNMALPVGTWTANSTWSINVPEKTDVVTDLNDPLQLPNNSVTAIFSGNVRLRVREVYATSNINPMQNNYTFGETEDYTITVLENCPSPTSNVCKWVGSSSSDWNTPSNWCPALPTYNDVVYIGLISAPYEYPTIGANTAAVCRMLNISNGAKLNIDANTNASLKVADDVNIGWDNTNATSAIIVSSKYEKTNTIPAKTALPPLGLAFSNVTPIRTNNQGKTQISYTALELSTTFGWKAGDYIDSIGIEVNSITLAPAAASGWQNFRIRAFSVGNTTTATSKLFPFPVPAAATNTKIAVETGDVGVNSTALIYQGTGVLNSLQLNMPMVISGTKAGGNYIMLPLIANSFKWDGNNLVLSIEYNTPAPGGTTPAKSYILYDENAGAFRTLAINYTTQSSTITGWNIDGQGRNSAGVSNNAGIVAAVSQFRPRLDFSIRRPYSVFPITVGGDWVNNNRNTSTTYPLIGGSAGFEAGYSQVIMDPATRNTVVSPGLLLPNAPYYIGTPGLSLVADQLQEITTGTNARTVFNQLVINKTGTTIVQQNSLSPSVNGCYADSLALTAGEFKLNRKAFTLKTGLPTYLVSGGGWLRSEDNGAPSPGTIQSKFIWQVGTNTGIHTIPFKGASANIFNFKYNLTAGDIGDLEVATYGTPSNNTPLPVLPQAVGVMSSNALPTPGADATPWTVDRFWYVKRSTTSAISGALTFEYDNLQEGTLTSAYVAAQMKAQRYGTTGWNLPTVTQTNALGVGNLRQVGLALGTDSMLSDLYTSWTITNVNATQGPLPIELLRFGAKAIDKRVKIWWDVQSERDVAMYSVERTADNTMFDVVAAKEPVGPSTSLLNYDAWDNSPLKGLQYYRLATNFNDGTVDYSKLVPVRFGDGGTFAISNIITNSDASLTVNFSYDSQLPYTYMITDMMGRTVATGANHNAQIGDNSIIIPVELSNGVYSISLINAEKVVSQKIVY